MNPNDRIRQQMLEYFYERNAQATSRMGKKGSAVKISDIKRQLKDRHALTQQQVMANLTYLIDNLWIKTVEVKKTVRVRGGTVPQVTTYHEITAKGIDKIEGGSQFEPRERYAGINVTATGKSIITLGDGNVVNAQFSELHSSLDELKEAITKSLDLTESVKLDLAVDIESIKDQLAKSCPRKAIIEKLWDGLKAVAVLSGVTTAYEKVVPHIEGLLR